MVITYTEEINGINYTFSADESLRLLAEPLLESLEYDIAKEKVRDGFRIASGFTTFMLSRHGDGYDIAAPDYTDDPLTVLTTDLTLALHIQYRQVYLLRRLGVVGKAVNYYDIIVAAKGALEKENIYMQRYNDPDIKGWVINTYERDENGKAIPDEADEYESFRAYELIKLRPALVDVLCLPDDYIAVFEGEELKAVLNDDNDDLLENNDK
ncbi:hypothetical protein [uncultured Ruminococcus sp.]|uniref:immunity protein Imm33 domain-containing protein n=1 Tax=uncultured Ruminococcus sp. TaxID=165186 RepID=UPI000EBD050F|nr:hypothetical protein [uncultured Ruminococcus sp.]HCJ41189.1 hypothetical protein [Ruminococcus sp.]